MWKFKFAKTCVKPEKSQASGTTELDTLCESTHAITTNVCSAPIYQLLMFIISDYSLFVLFIITISIVSTVYDTKSQSADKSKSRLVYTC